jgi:hypothetical protein
MSAFLTAATNILSKNNNQVVPESAPIQRIEPVKQSIDPEILSEAAIKKINENICETIPRILKENGERFADAAVETMKSDEIQTFIKDSMKSNISSAIEDFNNKLKDPADEVHKEVYNKLTDTVTDSVKSTIEKSIRENLTKPDNFDKIKSVLTPQEKNPAKGGAKKTQKRKRKSTKKIRKSIKKNRKSTKR